MHTYLHDTGYQKQLVGVSLLLPLRSHVSNTGGQVWHQVLLPAEPSCQPLIFFLRQSLYASQASLKLAASPFTNAKISYCLYKKKILGPVTLTT